MAVPGKLTVGSDGKLRGPATIRYNSPFPTRSGRYGSGAINGTLMHTMVCDLPVCIKIFNDLSKQASAHFGVAQDGTIWQFGPIGKGWIAWHAGNANDTWYGIEHADHGNPNNPLTSQQVTASAQLVECLSSYAGFPLAVTDSPSGRGYGVHNMGGAAWGGHTCPDLPPFHVRSAQRKDIIALAKQIHSGGGSAPVAATGKRFTMYDDVNVSLIPADATTVACYVNGMYANCGAVRSRFPKARIVTIAVTSGARAMFLDVEPGDATNAVAPGWMKDGKAHMSGPVIGVYTSASNAAALISQLARAGHRRSSYKLWSAHYTTEHVCGTGGCTYPRADATQWTHQSHGRELDQSLCEADFLGAPKTTPAPAPPPPPPAPAQEEDMPSAALPEEIGKAAVVNWSGGSVKGITITTDATGPVTYDLQEYHRKPSGRWLDKGSLQVTAETSHDISSPDDCSAVMLTLTAGSGASALHTYS